MSASDNSTSATTKKRPYRGHVQAELRALTHQRIIEAAVELYNEAWLDQITLEHVAQRAGVTSQTILRHFGTKEALVAAAGRQVTDAEVNKRAEVPVADLDAIIAYLIEHYETQGDQVLRGLAQETRYPAIAEFMEEGRIQHCAWVAHVFDPYLESRAPVDRERLLAQLVAICDVYTWKLLRRQAGLDIQQCTLALKELLRPLISDNSA